MKIRTVGVLSIASLAMSVMPLWAGPVGVQRSPSAEQQAGEVAYLQSIKDQQAREAMANPGTVKGPLLVRYMNKQAQLQDLINRIQRREQISPYEIDEALQPASP
jgi:hypothetical protein